MQPTLLHHTCKVTEVMDREGANFFSMNALRRFQQVSPEPENNPFQRSISGINGSQLDKHHCAKRNSGGRPPRNDDAQG
jgi:hypothetical protein